MWDSIRGAKGPYGTNQVWIVNRSSDGTYNFTNAHVNGKGAYAIELSGSDIEKERLGKIQIWRNQRYISQKWNLIAADED